MSTEQQQPDPVADLVTAIDAVRLILRHRRPGEPLMHIIAGVRAIAAAAQAVIEAEHSEYLAMRDAPLPVEPTEPLEPDAGQPETDGGDDVVTQP
jgi:hypothetical protein